MTKITAGKIPVFVVAGLIAGLAGAASAETNGWYTGAEAGVSIVPTIKFNALSNTWHEQQDPGYALAGQFGYGFGQIRLEGEIGWRQNDLSHFDNAAGTQTHGGSIGGLSTMANVYYDIPTGTRFTPYVGGGVGGLDLSSDHITAAGVPVTNDSQFVLAYQGIAGVSYAVNDRLSIKTDYRYLRTEKANLALNPAYGAGNGSGVYAAHAIMVGFTMKLGQPAAPAQTAVAAAPPPMTPPPPPPPAAKPVQAAPIAKSFILFFDWDKSDLTPEANAIVAHAAESAKKSQAATIELTGYTDLSGTASYNMALSVRRGEAVKKQLIALGIPGSEITVVGKGKSDPLVTTKDGVREAQNRRVTIVLP